MVQPVKGSGIGAVNIPEILTSKPKILQGLGTAIAPPVEGGGFIGLSEVPASGLPNIMPGETNIFDVEGSGSFTIPTKRGPETLSEFAKSNLSGFMDMFKPGPEDKIRQARARGQIIPGVSDEVEAMAIRDASDARATADAAGQLAGGQETSRILSEAAKGKIFGDQSKTTTKTSDGTEKTSTKVPGADTPAKQATVQALDEYLKQARPGVKPKEYADYIKEFSDATGLDVSGQPDNSTALMAFGLALMQNKAGKGFNVGNILSSVGEAGQTALPELTKARSEARALRAKAGEFAISRKREDQAAARNRQSIFVVPRSGQGKTEKDQLRDRLMKGRYISVNSYELDALANAEGFDQNYEIMPGDVLGQMDNLFKAEESKYSDKMTDFLLFGGADDAFKVKTYAPKPDHTNLNSRAISATEIRRAESAINNGLEKLDTLDKKFSEFKTRFSETPPKLFNQIGSDIFQFAQAIGIGLPDDFDEISKLEDDVAYQKRFTEYLATRYAPQILQEAGKTISDADRQRVQAIVGEIGKLKSPAGVAARMRELHEFIVLAGRKNMETAMVNLSRVGGSLESGNLSPDEERRYNQLVARYKIASAPKQQEKKEDE